MDTEKCLDSMNKEERLDFFYRCLQLMEKRRQVEKDITTNNHHIQMINEFNTKINLYDKINFYITNIKSIKQESTFYIILSLLCFLGTLRLLDVSFIHLPIIHEIVDLILSIALIPMSLMTMMTYLPSAINPIDFCINLYHQDGGLAILKILASYVCGLLILFIICGGIYCVYLSLKPDGDNGQDILEAIEKKNESLLNELRDIKKLLIHYEKSYTQQYDQERLLFNELGMRLLIEVENTNLYNYEEVLRQAYEHYKIMIETKRK